MREGHSFSLYEFAISLEQVAAGTAPARITASRRSSLHVPAVHARADEAHLHGVASRPLGVHCADTDDAVRRQQNAYADGTI